MTSNKDNSGKGRPNPSQLLLLLAFSASLTFLTSLACTGQTFDLDELEPHTGSDTGDGDGDSEDDFECPYPENSLEIAETLLGAYRVGVDFRERESSFYCAPSAAQTWEITLRERQSDKLPSVNDCPNHYYPIYLAVEASDGSHQEEIEAYLDQGQIYWENNALSPDSLLPSDGMSAYIQESGNLIIASPEVSTVPACCSEEATGEFDPYEKLSKVGPVVLNARGGERALEALNGESIELEFQLNGPEKRTACVESGAGAEEGEFTLLNAEGNVLATFASHASFMEEDSAFAFITGYTNEQQAGWEGSDGPIAGTILHFQIEIRVPIEDDGDFTFCGIITIAPEGSNAASLGGEGGEGGDDEGDYEEIDLMDKGCENFR